VYQYLAGRDFDPAWLSEHYGVGYCHSVDNWDDHRQLIDRIYLPMHMRGELMGWQGRGYRPEQFPPYYNMPGLKKSLMLYGFDQAAQHRDVVVVEGVTDVWRLAQAGIGAVALLGKTFSLQQRTLLIWTWAKQGGWLTILLDGEVEVEKFPYLPELRRGFDGRLRVLRLPGREDPADWGAERLRIWLQRQSRLALAGRR
jgi:hypothetical protein